MKEKHLPYKFVKFNKYRHKDSKWMTHGVIKSIKNRDRLYRELKCTINQLNHTKFHKNKAYICKTWGMFNETICKNKNNHNGIKVIMKDGNLIKEPKAIVENFNNFFVNIDQASC